MKNIISGVNLKDVLHSKLSHLHFLSIPLIVIYLFIQIIYRISRTMVTLHTL